MDKDTILWTVCACIGAAGFLAGIAYNPIAAGLCGLASCLFAAGNAIAAHTHGDDKEDGQ